MEARLSSPTDIAGFRSEARQLLAHQVPPHEVTWTLSPHAFQGVVQRRAQESRRQPIARAATSIVPASFLRLCEYVAQHHDADRFALLYRLLWRLVHEPGLRHDASDPDLSRAQHMAHAVRRDIHKLKANARFHPVADPARPGEPIHMAWCEPAHHVLETVASWFAKRQAAIRWALFTPERSAYWDGRQLHYANGGGHLSVTMPEAEWLARWQQVFRDGAQPEAGSHAGA